MKSLVLRQTSAAGGETACHMVQHCVSGLHCGFVCASVDAARLTCLLEPVNFGRVWFPPGGGKETEVPWRRLS